MKVIHSDDGEGGRMALIAHWCETVNPKFDDFKAWNDSDLEVIKNLIWANLLFAVPDCVLRDY